MSVTPRQLQQRIRSIERRYTRPASRAGGLLYYETLPPIGTTMLNVEGLESNGIAIYPLHPPETIEARVITTVSRNQVGEALTRYALALYRSLDVYAATKADLATTPGQFSLGLIQTLGGPIEVTSTDDTARHVRLDRDVIVEPSGYFLAVWLIDKGIEFFTPGRANTPHVGYRGASSNYLAIPDTLSLDNSTRQKPIYIALRSALGARLYGDPVTG